MLSKNVFLLRKLDSIIRDSEWALHVDYLILNDREGLEPRNRRTQTQEKSELNL